MPDWLVNISIDSGGSLGLQNASAADIAATTVDNSSTTATAISNSNQRKTFYGASRFWVFYSDGTNMLYKSSLNGTTWGSSTIVRIATTGDKFSIWWDSTYVHYAYASATSNTALIYRRGTPSVSGTITWSAEQNAIAASASATYFYPFITVDSNSKPVISYTLDNTTAVTPYIVTNNNSDGTWSTLTTTQMSATSENNTWRTTVLPLSSGGLVSIYAYDAATIKSKVYNGSTWQTENTTTSAIEVGSAFSAVVTSDNVVHLAFTKDSDDDIKYTHYHSGGTAWEMESTVYAGTSATMSPVLSKTSGNNFYCFWLGDNIANHIYYKANTSGIWNSASTDWLTESNITDNKELTSAYSQSTSNYIPVSWSTNTSSPYSTRFSALEVSAFISAVDADLPEDLSTFTISGAEGSARLYSSDYRMRWSNLDTNDEAYASKDYGANYFSGDFCCDFVLEIDSLSVAASPNFGLVWPLVISNGVNDYIGLTGANTPFVGVAVHGITTANFRLFEMREDGTYGYADYAFPSVTYYRPLYYSLARDDDAGTNSVGLLTLSVYTNPARTIPLEGATNPVASLSLKGNNSVPKTVDYTYGLLPMSYDWTTSSTGLTSGMVGELFVNNASTSSSAPDYFVVEDDDLTSSGDMKAKSIPFVPENQDDMNGYPNTSNWASSGNWTESEGGTGTVSAYNDSSLDWAHITSDPDENEYVYSTAIVTTGTRPAFTVGCKVQFNSDQGNYWDSATGTASVIRVLSSDNTSAPSIIVTKASGHYYWRILTSTSTAYEMTLGKTYKALLVHDVMDHISVYNFELWIHSTNDSAYTNWTLVDTLASSATYFSKSYNRVQVGNFTGQSGDFYTTDIKFSSWCSKFPSISRGTSALNAVTDGTLLLTVSRTKTHGNAAGDHYGVDVLSSIDNGATWTTQYFFNTGDIARFWPFYDDVTGKWWGLLYNYDGGSPATQLYEATGSGSSLFTAWTARGSAVTNTSAKPSRFITGASNAREMLCAIGIAGGDDGYFVHWQLYDPWGTIKVKVVRDTDTNVSQVSEGYTWRRPSDNCLMTIFRTGDTDAWNQMFYCVDASGSTNEGLNYQTGTADADVLNTLDDTSENFTTSNGSTRLQAVQIGWTVWNTTAGTRAQVTAVAPGSDVSRLTLSSDIFPAGTGNYYISCWSAAQQLEPATGATSGGVANDYYQKTAWLGCFAFGNYLWLQGSDRRTWLTTSMPYGFALIAKADAEDASIIAERQWTLNKPKQNTWSAYSQDCGNGDLDAMNIPGNHYLDYATNFGTAVFMRIDTVDAIATGPSITVSPSSWTEFYEESNGVPVSKLRENTWYTSDNDSNIDYFTVTNNGDIGLDILISGSENWTGTGVHWHVSSTGEPGNHTIGLWVGLESSGGYYILVKPDDLANFLTSNLGISGEQKFGLLIYTATSNGGNASMSGTVTLTAVVHT
jgi:hypothetical protein